MSIRGAGIRVLAWSMALGCVAPSFAVVGSVDSLRVPARQDSSPATWIELGRSAIRANQDDLAKGYFDRAIELANHAEEPILSIGFTWLENGRLETSLPYLIPNLSRLNADQLGRLGRVLADSGHVSAVIMILRQQASRSRGFSPAASLAAEWAFHFGRYALCRDILIPHAGALDSASAHRFLLSVFYGGYKTPPDIIRKTASDFESVEIKSLAALILAQQRDFKEARSFVSERTPLPIRGYIHALELEAYEKIEESTEFFRQALDSKWPEFHIVAMAELFKHYAITGNRYKVDQLWDEIQQGGEEDTPPALQELLARQFSLRGYEKQAHSIYQSLYRSHPDRPAALRALWDELVSDDSTGLQRHIQNLLAVDPLDCEANQLALRYLKAHNQNRKAVHHGRNVVLYCPDAVDPYFDLAQALLSVSRPAEARLYFAKYVRRGGDPARVPTYMR
jgi:hypothetical protein